MALDDLAITMSKIGSGEWELDVADGETYEVFLDEVDVDEQTGFYAEGRAEARDLLVELTTGKQIGGDVQLRTRPLDGDEWETVGPLEDARKQG